MSTEVAVATEEPTPATVTWSVLDLRTGTEVDTATFTAWATYMQSAKYHRPK